MTSRYFYGVRFLGRGESYLWFTSKDEAIWEAQHTDQKYMPIELVRMERNPVEHSGTFWDYYDDIRDFEWRKQTESPAR